MLFVSTSFAQTVTQTHFFSVAPDDGPGRLGLDNDNRAYPATTVGVQQQQASYAAFQSIAKLPGGKKNNWQQLGPITPNVSGPWTYTGRTTTDSGRVTALALSPSCHANDCKLFAAAAGGGVWEADNALAQQPNWAPSNNGIPSNAIGSLIFDPSDPSGSTLYAGTGEPNGSSDSEAGVGLYKSTDFGKSWSLVPGSMSVSQGRSIGAIAVDPVNPAHILIGTAVARHGSSSVNGGRFTPPGAPPIGLYESLDGGATFKLVFSLPSDVVNPGSPNGSDFFRGGVSKIAADRTGLGSTDATRFYFSIFDYGLYRSTGTGSYEQVFASAGAGSVAGSLNSRTEFALAPNGANLRLYLGDSNHSGTADFYRVDNALVPASTLTNGTTNPGWTKLSNSTFGTTGYSSWNFCETQCTYDMAVASPPGHPNTVWIIGSMAYNELGNVSNGRAVQRSVDAGVTFTDMTNDTQSPPLGMHPDQHAIVFAGSNPDIVIVGSDGGIVRTSGAFADASATCAPRGLTGVALSACQNWLKVIPTQIFSLNDGLATLQFQSLTINTLNPLNDIIGGTQDNGTWAYNGKGNGSWLEDVGGDGGQSGINPLYPNIRIHSYYLPQHDVNFNSNDPLGWDWISDPLLASGEAASFYTPLIADPKAAGTWFDGLQHVWRTQDNGGAQSYLDLHCNEFFGDFSVSCGDWVPIGGDLTSSTYGSDKGGSYVVAITRAASDTSTMWVATRIGRLFVSSNADAAVASVAFTRIDTSSQPGRFISGIAVDPANKNHAFVSFSGYNAYTPATPGHVFEVTYDPVKKSASWKDLSYNIGDQPVTGISLDDVTGDLFIATDFGVAMLSSGTQTWTPAAGSLPPVAVYGLAIDPAARVLYAATHGRGAWQLDLSQ
jgi:hypothetical protein